MNFNICTLHNYSGVKPCPDCQKEGIKRILNELDGEIIKRQLKEVYEIVSMYADDKFYFPRNIIRIAQKQGMKLAPCYSEFGKKAKEAKRLLEKILEGKNEN